MATQTLIIKDGSSNLTGLAVSSGSFGLVPEHTISGAVNVTASAANPVYVTGTVQISQPVSVDLVVGDNVFVTSSIAAPLYISSSANSPVLVTGTVSTTVVVSDGLRVTSSAAFPVYVSSSNNNPLSITGSVVVSDGLRVTSSAAFPVYVSSSNNNPINITGSTISSVFNLPTNSLWVTSSFTSPVYVSSSIGKELYVANTATTAIHVTSSQINPVVTKNVIATIPVRSTFSSFASTINWAGAGSSNISGTFILAQTSSVRKGLMFANNTNKDLYVALGDTDFASTNGFLLASTASAPSYYSFIVYPSGTYFAEPAFVNLKHSGFFVSSSNINVQISSVTTE